jgi:hypothetical protein
MKLNYYGFFFIIFLFSGYCFGQTPVSVRINNGAKVINEKEKKVTLYLNAPKAKQMMVSNSSDFAGANWETFVLTKPNWILEGEDGDKTIFVKFKDAAGNESPVITASVTLDRTAPQNCKVIIDNDAKYNNNPLKSAVLEIDADDATSMMVSNRADFLGATWIDYTSGINNWLLDGLDGEKTVYAKFKDAAGNISEIVKDQIIVDKSAPSGLSLKVNDGSEWTNNKDKKVTLIITATGASEMIIKQVNAQWEPYRQQKEFILEGEDGPKTVFVRFRDEAGNVSQPISANIKLDRTAPTNPRIMIDNGAEFTIDKTKKVNLRILASDASFMMIGNDPQFTNSNWEPYAGAKPVWTLDGEDGEKTVFIKFKDAAGNISEIASDKIKLDRLPPAESSLLIQGGKEYTNNQSKIVSLTISAKEAAQMMISNNITFLGATWEPFQPTKDSWVLDGEDGEKFVYVKFKDKAGNISETQKAGIKLDRIAPGFEPLKIDNGIEWTSNPEKLVTLNFNCKDAAQMMISNKNDFAGAVWEPYNSIRSNWKLEGEDGLKIVGVKFKDGAGNVSTVGVGKIKLKRNPPGNAKIVINNDSVITNHPDKKVTLYLTAEDAKTMMISNSEDFTNIKSEPFAARKSWILEGLDGEKNVYVKFKDIAGNETPALSDKIILDLTPPQECSIVINNDTAWTRHSLKKVKLRMFALDAVQMMVSNTNFFTGAVWEPYTNELKEWQLEGEDGDKAVFAKFKDQVGNVSSVVKDVIKLDRKAPTNVSVKINNGAVLANNLNRAVTLITAATDASHMAISNVPSFEKSEWEPFSNKRLNWILEPGDGDKIVYVRFRDDIGNISEAVNAKIKLDTKPPYDIAFSINNDSVYTGNKAKMVRLAISGKEASSLLISNRSDFAGARWETFKTTRDWVLDGEDGEKTIFMLFKDDAGNINPDTLQKTIALDRFPPKSLSFKINNGAEWCNDPEKKVSLLIKALEADFMMISNNSDLSQGTWEPYTESKEWILDGDDGEKVIYVKVKDKYGNQTDIVSSRIKLDRKF